MNSHNYGFAFNHIEIKEDILIKSSKNKYGKDKMKNEILFYKNILDNNIPLSIPTIFGLDISNSIIRMQYLYNSKTMTSLFFREEYNHEWIYKVKDSISKLHYFSNKTICKTEYIQHLYIETYEKLISRYKQTNWETISNYNKIKTVNHVKVKDFYTYINIIKCKIDNIVNNLSEYEFVLIHGDIHLGNILIDNKQDIFFIDPRGYFGNDILYGVKEYDYAKLLFGVSGYSLFDEMEINDILIKDGNLQIDFISKYDCIYTSNIFDDYTKLLSLTIWLSNNSSFINNNKKIISLMSAFYLCEKFL
jgi:tRNA A-37 threonylcarbamoyl transferase component Bud32